MMQIFIWLLKWTMPAALILASVGEAVACSCMASGPPCQNAFRVDAVFAGTVRTISQLPDDRPPLPEGHLRMPLGLRVEFIDVQGFRGVPATTLSVVTASGGASCGYGFKQGVRYLVYAHRSSDGSGLVASTCSRTRPITEAADDLRFLEGLTTMPPARSRVSGTITHWERALATGVAREIGPVPDVIVTARGPGTAFEAVTDARGHYELAVPPGKYELTALPPAAFSTRYLQQTIELPDPRACFVADLSVRYDGRVKGIVRRASGEPAAGAAVEIMAAESVDKTGNIQTLRAVSDGSGRYEFTEVSPGRYVVGVDLVRRMDAEVVFPTTFHPGTSQGLSATVIELKGGERRELHPLTLPPPRRSQRLTGTVVFEDGSPATGVSIALRDGRETWRQVAAGMNTRSDGSFSFVVHEGLSYVAGASLWVEADRRQLSGTVGPFVIDGPPPPLTVVLSRREE